MHSVTNVSGNEFPRLPNSQGLHESSAIFAESGQVPALSGLRGFAALWVMSFHLCSFLGNQEFLFFGFNLLSFFNAGHFGVDLFFVLSGCLLGRPFIMAMLGKSEAPKWRHFWLQRCRRILPAYWAQLGLLVLLAGWSSYDVKNLLAHITLTFNFFKNPSAINPVYWSLPIEWDFYLLLPIIALGFNGKRNFLIIVASSIVFVLAFRILCWQTLFRLNADGLWLFRLIVQLPARIDQFMIGILAAWLLITFQNSLVRWGPLISIASIALIALTATLTLHHGDVLDDSRVPWAYFQPTFVAIGFAGLIIASCTSRKGLSRLWSTRFMQFSGLVSYSLYLWHYPVGQYFSQHKLPGPVFTILFITTSFFIAYLSWRFIERRFFFGNTTLYR